ncbi:thioredoxin [Testudinibacter sp. P27/CKL/0425]
MSAYLKQTETRQTKENKMSEVVHATDASFESDVLQSTIPVVLDFWAPWCGPCKMIAPILDDIAAELDGKVKVVKINVDENQQVAAQFGVRSIPTLVIFNEGKVAATQVGALPKNQLIALIEKSVA